MFTQENQKFYTTYQPVQNDLHHDLQFVYMEDEQEFAVNFVSIVWPLQSNILCQDNFQMLVDKIAPFADEYQNMEDFKKLKLALSSDDTYDSQSTFREDIFTTALQVQYEKHIDSCDDGKETKTPVCNNASRSWPYSGLCSLRSDEIIFDYDELCL